MIPKGDPVPGKRGTFGSAPITLSKDYRSLGDLCDSPFSDLTGPGAASPNPGRGYVQAEYLLWWMSNLNVPVLATTNNLGGFGFLGETGTSVFTRLSSFILLCVGVSIIWSGVLGLIEPLLK